MEEIGVVKTTIRTSREYAKECCVESGVQVCVALGLERAEENVLEALAEVARYFVNTIAQRTQANMIHAQRGVVALNDVLSAFHQAPTCQVSWRGLDAFVFDWNSPSALVVPALPIPARPKRKRPPPKGLPSWFPPLPSQKDDKFSMSEIQNSSKKLKTVLARIQNAEEPDLSSPYTIDLSTTGETDHDSPTQEKQAVPPLLQQQKRKLNVKLLLHPTPSSASSAGQPPPPSSTGGFTST